MSYNLIVSCYPASLNYPYRLPFPLSRRAIRSSFVPRNEYCKTPNNSPSHLGCEARECEAREAESLPVSLPAVSLLVSPSRRPHYREWGVRSTAGHLNKAGMVARRRCRAFACTAFFSVSARRYPKGAGQLNGFPIMLSFSAANRCRLETTAPQATGWSGVRSFTTAGRVARRRYPKGAGQLNTYFNHRRTDCNPLPGRGRT